MAEQDHAVESDPRVNEEQGPTTDTDKQGGGAQEPVREYRGAGIMWGAIGLGLVLVVFLIIVIQNGHNVDLDFLWLSVETPLSLIVAVAVASSLLLGEAVGFVWRRRRRAQLQDREELGRLRKGRRGR